MLKYILKRLLQSVLTVLIIVSVVFLLMRMMPTDYFFTEDELIKLTESQKQSKLEAAGLLDPPLVQLQHFFQNMFKVDYIYATKQQALINTQLHSGVGEGVHSAVEGAINKYYTDAEAAAKEIDKINNKILTDNIISKQIDSALQGENGTDGAWVAEQLASNLSSKALGTLFKDAKKAIGEEQAGQLRDELDTTLRSKMSELLSGVDLEVNATGFKNILNHLVPSNYSFTFSLGESYRIRHGVSVIEIISDKFPISMRIADRPVLPGACTGFGRGAGYSAGKIQGRSSGQCVHRLYDLYQCCAAPGQLHADHVPVRTPVQPAHDLPQCDPCDFGHSADSVPFHGLHSELYALDAPLYGG